MKHVRRFTHTLILIILLLALVMPSGLVAAAPQGQADPAVAAVVQVEAAAAGRTYTLTIINRTKGKIDQLTLKGPQTYVFRNIPLGRSRYQVVKGSYKVSYRTVCGINVLNSIKVNGNFILTTPFCGTQKIVLENRTGSELTLTLSGPRTYQIRVPVGKTKYEFFYGTYQYTVVAACGTRSGKIIIDARLRIWKWKC